VRGTVQGRDTVSNHRDVQHQYFPYAGCPSSWGSAFQMAKKYELVRDRIPLPGGGFVEAFRMALIDLSCFGEGYHLDLTGYPHESEAAALYSDWEALGVDFRKAGEKVLSGDDEPSVPEG
jgi:hypothetical protein